MVDVGSRTGAFVTIGRCGSGFCHDGRVERGKVGTLRTARSGTMLCDKTQHQEHSHVSIPVPRRPRPSIFPACLPGLAKWLLRWSHSVTSSFDQSRLPLAFEETEVRVRETMNALGYEVLGASIESRDGGASRIQRAGQSWFRVAATPRTIMTSLGPVTYRRPR